MKAAILSLAAILAVSTVAQQKKPAAQSTRLPVFHGITLGASLRSQFTACKGASKLYDESKQPADQPAQLCYEPELDSDAGIQYLNVYSVSWGVETHKPYTSGPSEFEATILIDVNDHITVEGIELGEPVANTEKNFTALREKYGQPSCGDNPMRTGIGLPVGQVDCEWRFKWGVIGLKSPADNLNRMTITARTLYLLQYLAGQYADDVKAAKDKF